MVKTETVLVGGAALVAAAFALGMGDESSGNNMTNSAGGAGVSEAVRRVIPTREYQPPTNGDVAMDTPTGPTQDPSRPPAPDSITGVTGFVDANYGGASGTVNPDSTNLENPYLAELYDTDTGE